MDGKNLAIDLAALAAYLVAANPAITGIGLHEWLGLGAFAVLFVHVAMHMDWVVETLRSAFRRPTLARMGNLVLDAFILAAFATVTVSGLLISGAVLPALGWYAPGYYVWDPLHAVAAKVLLALLVIHVAVHGKWFAAVLRKGRGKRDAEQSEER